MAYEMVMPYHLHMPSYFLETFTEYPYTRQVVFGRANLAPTSKMTVSSTFWHTLFGLPFLRQSIIGLR
ncbi:hypothetical protein, partial [Phocaeicola massiliensis]|uniref:hypothetical protein n=1 Tax=Phocaeicola massiliensis TaxID=204516 RepID=UPI001E2F21B7